MPTGTNPLSHLQFYIKNNDASEYDLNVTSVWEDYTGEGVRIGIIDDGFDLTHADLRANFDTANDRDFASVDSDPSFQNSGRKTDANGDELWWTPGGSLVTQAGASVFRGSVAAYDQDSHGTAVAGIIGAVDNDEGIIGVAHGATMIGFRQGGSLALERLVFEDARVPATDVMAKQVDIVNQSQGRGNTGVWYDSTTRGVEEAIEHGRKTFETDASGNLVLDKALGTVFVKSAGNSRDDVGKEESTLDPVEAHRGSIVVGAVDFDGDVSYYSTPGANLLVSAFGTDGNIVTTDIEDDGARNNAALGRVKGDYTFDFNGTSSAAPMVTGVVALMLEANPELGWRDVQSILANSARHVGSDVGEAAEGDEMATVDGASWFWNDAHTWNGGGMHFSNDYGFGLVDAHAAVRLAETWTSQSISANEHTTWAHVGGEAALDYNDRVNHADFTVEQRVKQTIEYVEVELDIDTGTLPWLSVTLISAEGTEVSLVDETGLGRTKTIGVGPAAITAPNWDLDGTWTFGTNALRGEDSDGTWTVSVTMADGAATVGNATIRTYGEADVRDDVFVFTNEFAALAFDDAARQKINGYRGDDTINASAVTSSVEFDLEENTGNIEGVGLTIKNIDNVYTGDGDDLVIGDKFTDMISTGRGDDYAFGGRTSETIDGGEGDDVVDGGRGKDQIHGGAGDDTLDGGAGSDRFVYDDVYAIGDDVLDGGSGRDALVVMANDTGRFYGLLDVKIESIEKFVFAGDADGDLSLQMDAGAIAHSTGSALEVIGRAGARDQFTVQLGRDTQEFTGRLKTGAGFDDADDVLEVVANSSGNEITGIDGTENYILGYGGDDTLVGGSEGDALWGGSGSDVLIGGAGNDRLNGHAGNDRIVVTLADADVVDGGTGFDTLDIGAATAAVDIDLGAGRIGSGLTFSNIEAVETGAGADRIQGDQGDNRIASGDAADTIDGGAGDDTIEAGRGDDVVRGGRGRDQMDGGAGYDWLLTDEGNKAYHLDMATGETNWARESAVNFEAIQTGGGDDVIQGTEGANEIVTGQGTDRIDGRGGDDLIEGGDGHDTIDGGTGNDTIQGGGGRDIMDGGEGYDWLIVTEWDGAFDLDMVTGETNWSPELAINFEAIETGDGNNEIIGTDADNKIVTHGGNDVVHAGEGNDTVDSGDDNDVILGGAGSDEIRAGGGDDRVQGGSGADVLDGGDGFDIVFYTEMTDDVAIRLDSGFTSIAGETATNFEGVSTGSGNDDLIGNDAGNLIAGGDGDDTMVGGDGDDTVEGGAGNDRLTGNADNDVLKGGAGEDQLWGGTGNDVLSGGTGSDQFVYRQTEGQDRITDFEVGVDVLNFLDSAIEGQSDIAVTETEGGVHLDFGPDGGVLLENVSAADLSADSFMF